MKRRLPIIVLLGVSLAAPAAVAEVAYVTDMLQLGLHRAADTSDRAFQNLISGTRLEILERTVNYARVRTPDGNEGWVKAAYIVTETPARFQVADLEARLAALGDELALAKAVERRASEEAARLRAHKAAEESEWSVLEQTVARLERQNAEYAARFDGHQLSLPLPWVLGAVAMAFVAGGVAGWWSLDLLIRRRHAGFRVY